MERTVLGVLSMDCSFDKLFHPFSATKAEGLVEVLRVFSEGVNNVEVLSVKNLWVASTDPGRSLYGSIQEGNIGESSSGHPFCRLFFR